MFYLTKEERLVLVLLVFILLSGSSIRYAFKKNPNLARMVNIVESDRLYRKMDINKASREELIKIPYIGEAISGRIIEYREDNGSFTDLEELKSVQGINNSNYAIITKYLKPLSKRK